MYTELSIYRRWEAFLIKKQKKAFTLVEVLVASSVMSVVMLAGISIMVLISSTLFKGQIEGRNRVNLNDNLYYITREIQSAQSVKVDIDGKTLKIMQLGGSAYSLEYSIQQNNVSGELHFNGKRMLDVDYGSSKFSINGNAIKVELALLKNNLDKRYISQPIAFEVMPRADNVAIEVGD